MAGPAVFIGLGRVLVCISDQQRLESSTRVGESTARQRTLHELYILNIRSSKWSVVGRYSLLGASANGKFIYIGGDWTTDPTWLVKLR